MPSNPASDQPDAGTLCDQIHIFAQLNVAQAFKNSKEVAPAAEMTLSGLQDSEAEAYNALLDVYCMSYQRVVDGLSRVQSMEPVNEPIKYNITILVQLCAFLGAYQASKDIQDGIGMESSERMEDVGPMAFGAVLDVAESAVKEYHLVCASQYLWELEQAERVLLAEDIARVEKGEGGVMVVMENSARHLVVEGDVGAAVYARLLATAEKAVEGVEEVRGAVGGGEDRDTGGGGAYPVVNAGTASESMYG